MLQAQAEQSSGGFGAWFRSSWLGRAFGFSNEEPVEAPAGQDQTAIASSTETEGKAPTTQTGAERGPSDARRTLASAGQRYQEQRDVSQHQRGSERDV